MKEAMWNQKSWAKGYIIVLVLVALIGPVFTSNAPLKVRIDNQTIYPALRIYMNHLGLKSLPADWQTKDWKKLEGGIQNLIPWDASYIDLTAINGVAPGEQGHLLGSDLYGRDVAAGLIAGTRVSLFVAVVATFFGLFLAFLLTFFTSYIGNRRWQLTIWQLIFMFIVSGLTWFYLFVAFPQADVSWAISLMTAIFSLFLLIWLTPKIARWTLASRKPRISIPMDEIGLKFYEIFQSIPKLILLLVVIGMIQSKGSGSSVLSLGLLMGALIWPVFYRYLRLEIQREKSTDFFESLRNLGFGDLRITIIHLFPKAFRSIIVPAIFVFSSAILLESTLSFLGLGLSDQYVSWGKILAQARLRIDAWWLAVFPGLLIFLTLYVLNIWSKEQRN